MTQNIIDCAPSLGVTVTVVQISPISSLLITEYGHSVIVLQQQLNYNFVTDTIFNIFSYSRMSHRMNLRFYSLKLDRNLSYLGGGREENDLFWDGRGGILWSL